MSTYEVPFGMSQQWGFYGFRDWGLPTLGGPVVTAGGVVFIGASMDSRVRALDAATGRQLWSDLVEAPAVANPAVFTHEGVDYVVFVAGGNSILKPRCRIRWSHTGLAAKPASEVEGVPAHAAHATFAASTEEVAMSPLEMTLGAVLALSVLSGAAATAIVLSVDTRQ
jgi:hypothetical protein